MGIWFNLEDTTTNPSDKSRNFGLLRHDGSRKEAYGALKAWTAKHDSVHDESEEDPALTLTAEDRSSGIVGSGTTASSAVKLRAYRYLSSRERYGRTPRHRLSADPDEGGRYSGEFAGADLTGGRWKIVARASHDGESLRQKDVVRWRD